MTDLNWPSSYSRDPSFALLRPLVDPESRWLSGRDTLQQYLLAQARRIGGRGNLLEHFSWIAALTKQDGLKSFLLDPFTQLQNCCLVSVFSADLPSFLSQRFKEHPEDPWEDYPEDQSTHQAKMTVSEEYLLKTTVDCLDERTKKKILKQETKKLGWSEFFQLASENGDDRPLEEVLIQRALRENPELLDQVNPEEELARQLFSRAKEELSISLGPDQLFCWREAPILIGRHYLNNRHQLAYFTNRNRSFHKIIGSYARWDDAKIIIFREEVAKDPSTQKLMLQRIQDENLRMNGAWRLALSVERTPAYLAILTDADLPADSFYVGEWEVNVDKLLISLATTTKETSGDC